MSTTFADLGVTGPVREALDARGISDPFPVQELVLPVAMAGRDVMVSSPTGSGKTLAFGLPLVHRLERRGARPSALVLAPTRELARQIDDELTPLAAAAGFRTAVCYGGVGIDRQATQAARADILVATPGRLIDLVGQRRVSLTGIVALVLDEADRMLDMGFLPQVMSIVRELPSERQTMFFSATLDGDVGKAAAQLTRSPERLRVREGAASGAPLGDRLDQGFVACTAANRTETLLDLIGAEDDLVLVFCRTRRGAERLSARLAAKGIAAASMHGNLSQSQRERALSRFTKGTARVLVATDVAARGIDLDDIGLVINFDPPEDRDAYTHRVGRTARAGRTGRAITMVMPEQAAEMSRLAVGLGLEDGWETTGYALAPARVVYGSRRKGSAFGPSRPSRPRPDAASAPPRANRVPRRSARTGS
jgi:ATP-dependent RNA helicase RhlE